MSALHEEGRATRWESFYPLFMHLSSLLTLIPHAELLLPVAVVGYPLNKAVATEVLAPQSKDYYLRRQRPGLQLHRCACRPSSSVYLRIYVGALESLLCATRYLRTWWNGLIPIKLLSCTNFPFSGQTMVLAVFVTLHN